MELFIATVTRNNHKISFNISQYGLLIKNLIHDKPIIAYTMILPLC